eukprot:scaffold9878_cov45-Attheya_sp.AAC.5
MAPTTTTTNIKTEGGSKNTAAAKKDHCCPEFDSAAMQKFDEKEITFKNKPFVKEKTWCFLHVPLNFGGAMTRASTKIEDANAALPEDEFIMLSDLISPWSTRIYLGVSKDDVAGAEVVHTSGTFLTKVFEGPYKDFDKWIKAMKAHVKKEKGESFDVESCDLYAHYATCPGCAKKFGKNYTVLLMKVD